MKSTRGRSLSLIVVGSITLTAGCAQHRVATSFGELEPRLKRGQTIYVTTVSGETHKGKLEALSAGHARVTISGSTVQVPARDTVGIAVPEPLWQGAVIGAAAGAVLGAAGQATAQSYDCFLGAERSCESGTPALGLLMGAGFGSALGAGIDALVWRRTSVFSLPQTSGSSVVIFPGVGRGTAGIRLTAVF